eukprot:m.35294 g.35294  ORF g.35294 m.35294 type:complete len:304 (-) comp14399_c0_seq1:340-1251(-)
MKISSMYFPHVLAFLGIVTTHGVTSQQSGPPCRADLDCNLQSPLLWRCQKSTSATGPNANCHLPGPGSAGNSTCACQSPTCGVTKNTNKSATVQYLMLGDSISLGMQSDVSNLLKPHGWHLVHTPGNAASANLGAHCVQQWTLPSQFKWNVISFNHGLHDLGFDTERISVEQYSALLTNVTTALVEIQKNQGTKLLWVATTPVPTVPTYSVDGPCNETSKCLNPPRFDADVVLYNAAAAKVIAAANANGAKISTLDLYNFVLEKCGGKGYSHCDGFQLPANVHYTAQGWSALAAKTAAALLAL